MTTREGLCKDRLNFARAVSRALLDELERGRGVSERVVDKIDAFASSAIKLLEDGELRDVFETREDK